MSEITTEQKMREILIKAVSEYHIEVSRVANGLDSGRPTLAIIDKALAQLLKIVNEGKIEELKLTNRKAKNFAMGSVYGQQYFDDRIKQLKGTNNG